ncbi:hypothetical protein Save01_06754 [Streptomyces avermitilis]
MLSIHRLPVGPPLPAVITLVPAPQILTRHQLLWRSSVPSRRLMGMESHGPLAAP